MINLLEFLVDSEETLMSLPFDLLGKTKFLLTLNSLVRLIFSLIFFSFKV